jgi:cell wall-associated NlpC family hydrolase
VTRRGSGLAAAVVVALLAVVAPAHAGLASKRAEAARVQAQLAALDAKLERATEAYDRAHGRLTQTEHAIADNQTGLRLAQANLRVAKADLAQVLVDSYKNGDPDAVQVLLSASSLSDVVDRVALVQRTKGRTAEVVNRVVALNREIRDRATLLARQKAQRATALAQRAADRAAIDAGIAQRNARLSSIKSDIRAILDAQAAAQLARSRRIATQVRASQSDNANDPGIGGSADGSTGSSIAPPPSSTGSGAADAALSQIGVPYRWAGASPGEGFDCSGLVMWAYAQVGVSLPHNAAAQHGSGTPVSRDQLEPGDLVFFDGDGHVGIYIGNGEFVHAPHTGDVVKISSLDGYSGYNGAVRIG